MKTKWMIGSTVLVVCLFLSACSTEGEVQEEVEQINIEFFQTKENAVTFFDEIIHEFELENPHITVEQVSIPDGMAVLKTRIARGDVPDIFITYPIEQDYVVRANNGYLLDITDETFIQQVDEDIQSRYLINGRMYGVALSQNAVGVIYNKDVFDELGIDIPETWNQFIETLELLELARKQPILFANKELESVSVFNLNLVANEFDSHYWSNLTNGLVNIQDDPRWEEVAEKMLAVLEFAQENSFSYDADAVIKSFSMGEGAMFVSGVWALPELEKLEPNINYGMFPFPATNDPENNKILGGVDGGFAIAANTEYPEEAKQFLAFLLEQENAQRFSDFEGNISAVNGVKMNKPEVSLLAERLNEGKSVNWPNHYWGGGTAAEVDYRRISQLFYFDRDLPAYLKKLDNMFDQYR
ncbi:ABC transporter substrate-binding protein [Halalkalibacter okhensis]|uniref:ABC transporter substrate-binding protein n=1 Tax=Halalkalibacter okhensis TaxID=333138 RepID=A0A0B0IPG3_9BACI|nr:extracellular solute-binding protein [Halalkalibacter okhensis]KHF41571.1 hypothetical protein LQ50_02355 [Halalkalibacter okhensis]